MVDPPTPSIATSPAAVAVLRWPSEASLRADACTAGRPCLLLVEPGARPPEEWGELEDWLRMPADPRDLSARRQSLAIRAMRIAPPVLDDDGLLRRGELWEALSPIELRAMQVLLHHPGALVGREVLLDAVRGDDRPRDEARAFDHSMQRLRRRVEPLGLDLHTVRGTGYVLEINEVPL